MNPLYNPFSPGAGSQPPELAGREDLLDKALLTLARVKRGRSEKSFLLVGLRGVGKTVLLKNMGDLAKKEGYQVIKIEAHEKKSLAALLLPELRKILFELDVGERVSAKVKKAFRVMVSFVSKIKLSVQDLDFGVDLEPERGVADSGDLESDLAQVFLAVAEAAQDRNTAIGLIIDEMQYLSEEELSALIMAMHKISQENLPLVLIGAGLPQLVGKAGRSKSYAERLFDYPEVGSLKPEDARDALQKPVEREGVSFTAAALDQIVKVTEAYPYFLQEWGYQAWNLAKESPIDLEVAHRATEAALRRLDDNFFRVRFDRLTPREKDYLSALAKLGSDSQRSGTIADGLGVDVQNAAPIRNSLIKKGMIYSPCHGDTAFTVPLFEGFMKRVIE